MEVYEVSAEGGTAVESMSCVEVACVRTGQIIDGRWDEFCISQLCIGIVSVDLEAHGLIRSIHVRQRKSYLNKMQCRLKDGEHQ